MLVTLLVWGYTLLMPLPYGWALQKVISKWFNEPGENRLDPALLWLLGLLVLTTFASIFTFFIPINLLAHAILLAGAVILAGLWLYQRPGAFAQWLKGVKFQNYLVWVLLVLATFTTLEIATHVPTNSDTGIYHAQAIRWIETYPVVPGLGNLNTRFAYNSSWLVTNALFSFIFLGGRSFHLLASVFFLVTLFYSGNAASQLLKNGFSFSVLFKAFLLPVAFYVLASEVSSPGTDLPATLITWMVFAEWLTQLESGKQPSQSHAVILLLFTIFAVTIKLSAAPLVLAGLWLFFSSKAGRWAGSLLKCIALVLIVALPWLGRNIIISGYLIYPFPAIDLFSVDWKIPLATAVKEPIIIQNWSRLPTQAYDAVAKMPFLQWSRQWWANLTIFRKVMLDSLLIMPAVFLLYGSLRHSASHWNLNFLIKYWPVYLVAYLGMAFWFYAAPNFRFGYSYIMTSSLLVVLPWLMLLHNNLSINEKGLVSALLVLFISFQALTLVESIDWNTLASRQILPADYKSLPTAPCQLANTTVFQPDKDSWSECWYRAFPCTYQCDPHVALRGTTLQEGFRYLP